MTTAFSTSDSANPPSPATEASATSADATLSSQKRALRKKLRAQRAMLCSHDRRQAAAKVMQHIRRLPAYRASQRVGIYLHSVTELPTDALQQQNQLWDKQSYVPVITALQRSTMLFGQITAQTHYTRNRLGIVQPVIHRKALRRALELDIIFVPLVGFDKNGNRLGMGMGFYDRFLAHRLYHQHFKRPIIIGLAFNEQQEVKVPHDRWDVPLDAVVTPSGIIYR